MDSSRIFAPRRGASTKFAHQHARGRCSVRRARASTPQQAPKRLCALKRHRGDNTDVELSNATRNLQCARQWRRLVRSENYYSADTSRGNSRGVVFRVSRLTLRIGIMYSHLRPPLTGPHSPPPPQYSTIPRIMCRDTKGRVGRVRLMGIPPQSASALWTLSKASAACALIERWTETSIRRLSLLGRWTAIAVGERCGARNDVHSPRMRNKSELYHARARLTEQRPRAC